MNVRAVVCEGYHDRSFWAEWLERHLGCTPMRDWKAGTEAQEVAYRLSQQKGPTLGYATSTGAGIVLTCAKLAKDNAKSGTRLEGRSVMRTAVAVLVNQLSDDGGVDHLVVSVDSDDDGEVAGSQLCEADVRRWADLTAVPHVHVTLWRADDRDAPGMPRKQTLERLVCASIAAAYPDCAADVQAWLDSRRAGPTDPSQHTLAMQGKSAAFSFQAGWWPKRAGDDFFRAVWQDPAIATELETRLRQSGAWAIAQRLAA